MENKWIIYLLKSDVSSHTYIGATKNFNKRLRQHNGILKGGAKYTHANRPWKCVLIISGLPDKISALCLEWRLKRDRNMHPISGLKNRIYNVFDVLNLERFTRKCNPTSDITLLTITFYNNFFSNEYCLLYNKDNIKLLEY